MHLQAGPSQPCTLNGPLVLQDLVVSGRLSGWVLCQLLLPGKRLCQRPGEGGKNQGSFAWPCT